MKYTSFDSIALRLKFRVNVSEDIPLPGRSTMSRSLDPALVELVAEGVEARFDTLISQYYNLPLYPEENLSEENRRCKIIVSSIVEKLIVAELMGVSFEGTPNPLQGGDTGYGALLNQQAKEEIAQITEGINPAERGRSDARKLILPGASRLTKYTDAVYGTPTIHIPIWLQRENLYEETGIDFRDSGGYSP